LIFRVTPPVAVWPVPTGGRQAQLNLQKADEKSGPNGIRISIRNSVAATAVPCGPREKLSMGTIRVPLPQITQLMSIVVRTAEGSPEG
jgi:hypothetical protein